MPGAAILISFDETVNGIEPAHFDYAFQLLFFLLTGDLDVGF